jgi:transcription initiation factor TFIIB
MPKNTNTEEEVGVFKVGEEEGKAAAELKGREQLHKLSMWQKKKKLSTTMEKNLLTAQTEIDRIASLLSLEEETKENCMEIYREALGKNLIRGRTVNGVVAASFYITCRKYSVPRTLDEIKNATHIERKEILRLCRMLAKRLGIKLYPASPLEYIAYFCSKLKLGGYVEKKAMEITKEAIEKDMTSGKGPTGIAAAAIYIASILGDDKRTQRDISEVTGITEVTLRVRYKEMARKLKIDLGKK